MSEILKALKRKVMKPKTFEQASALATKVNQDLQADGGAGYYLKSGNIWNPLRTYERNAPCFCGSHQKAKRCCLPKLIPYCSQKDAVLLSHYIDAINSGGFAPLKNVKKYLA